MIDKVLLLISNMPQYPKNVENLFNEYINDIREWFKYNNKFGLDGHEFESSFYTKVIEKDTLSFFDPNANIEFKTWLEKVLYHHYTDLLRHEFAKKNLPDRDSIDDYDERFAHVLETKISYEPDHFLKPEFKKICALIIKLMPVKNRVLVKLKLYYLGIFSFDDEEFKFMHETTGLDNEQIIKFIENQKYDNGKISGSNIAYLTGYAEGSVTTLFKRIVENDILIPYKIKNT